MLNRIAVALGVLALATLTACTAPADDTNTPTPNPPVQSEEELPEGFDAFREELAEIDPKQAERKDRPVLDDVENTCGDLERGEKEDIVLKHVEGRFTVDRAQAEEILAAIKKIC